jgi:hypothetical protein
VQEGLDGEPRVILDPNALDESGLTALQWIEPSPDGSLMAFGLYTAGDELAVLYLLDVASGEWLADEIPNRVRGVSWLPDGRSFIYHRLAQVDNPYSTQILHHRVGTHHRQDRLIFEQYKEGPLATTWGPWGEIDDQGRWLLLGYWTGTDSLDLRVADFRHWLETGELALQDIVVDERAISEGPVIGDTLFMRTALDAPNGRVIAVDLRRPGREHWREIIPERADAVVTDVSAARGILVITYLQDAANRIERFDFSGRPLGPVELPGLGTASVYTAEDRTEAFFAFESFNRPDSIYRTDLATGDSALWVQPEVPVDPSLVEVSQVFYGALRRQPHPADRLRRLQHRPDPVFQGHQFSLVRERRRLRAGQPAGRQRIRRGLASGRHAREEAERVRRLHRGGRVAHRAGLYPPRAAGHHGRLQRRPADWRGAGAAPRTVRGGGLGRAPARHAALPAFSDGPLLGAGVRQRRGSGAVRVPARLFPLPPGEGRRPLPRGPADGR